MIILYTFINEEKHQSLLDKYVTTFSKDFERDILKYKRWQDAQLSLLGRVLLQHGLNTYYSIYDTQIEHLPNKKPYLKGHNLHFNISHSKDLVVCIIADFPVGIDVEFINDKINYLDFQFQMTPGEFQEIHHSEDKIKSFFVYWTRKEAVMKAHGGGMMIPLDSFEIVNNECIIDNEKFSTMEIFIDDNYQSCIASGENNLQNVIPHFVAL
ncbi:4'-phosphopantetheinyl transferase family protein [Chryseobacterium sp. M5A1_1a]